MRHVILDPPDPNSPKPEPEPSHAPIPVPTPKAGFLPFTFPRGVPIAKGISTEPGFLYINLDFLRLLLPPLADAHEFQAERADGHTAIIKCLCITATSYRIIKDVLDAEARAKAGKILRGTIMAGAPRSSGSPSPTLAQLKARMRAARDRAERDAARAYGKGLIITSQGASPSLTVREELSMMEPPSLKPEATGYNPLDNLSTPAIDEEPGPPDNG